MGIGKNVFGMLTRELGFYGFKRYILWSVSAGLMWKTNALCLLSKFV